LFCDLNSRLTPTNLRGSSMQFKPLVKESIELAREALKLWRQVYRFLVDKGLYILPAFHIELGSAEGYSITVDEDSIFIHPEADKYESDYVIEDGECYMLDASNDKQRTSCEKLVKIVNSISDEELEKRRRELEELVQALKTITATLKLTP